MQLVQRQMKPRLTLQRLCNAIILADTCPLATFKSLKLGMDEQPRKPQVHNLTEKFGRLQ